MISPLFIDLMILEPVGFARGRQCAPRCANATSKVTSLPLAELPRLVFLNWKSSHSDGLSQNRPVKVP